jgi:ATP-dependent Clp protease protease subunit
MLSEYPGKVTVKIDGLSRARLSHLMDAETWMDANKAVELGFADGILYAEDGAAGQLNKVTGQNDSGMDNGRSADELRERLNFIKKFI